MQRYMQAVASSTRPNVDPVEDRFSIDEAAQMIGISAISVRREIQRGRLGCYRICGGRVLRVGRSHIEEYLRRCEQASVEDAFQDDRDWDN
jgi:excisionase family DNA binding protein